MSGTFQRIRRRISSLRFLALATLFLLGYVSSFAHDVTVRHSLCAAHGEWEHDSSASAELGFAPGFENRAPQVRSAPERTADVHEHCAIVLVTRSGSWLAPGSPLAISQPALDVERNEFVASASVREVGIRPTPARGPPASV